MTDEMETARADLAFMRQVAEGDPRPPAAFGLLLFIAGASYGLQVALNWLWAVGAFPLGTTGHIILAATPNVVFLTALTLVLWRNRGTKTTSVVARGLESAFQATGLANLAMVVVFGVNAVRAGDPAIWYFYFPVVCALQGGAWFVAWRLRRRGWYGVIAIGWLASAIGLGLTIGTAEYLAIGALALFLFMALPGAIMMRQASRKAG